MPPVVLHVLGRRWPQDGRPQPVIFHALESIESGTARHLADLVCNLTEFSHVVAVPSRRHGGNTDTAAVQAMASAGAEICRVEMRRHPPTALQNVTAFVELARLVRRKRPDVVHTHSTMAGILGRLAAVRAGAPRIHTLHGIIPGAVAHGVERSLGRITDRLVALSPSEAELIRRTGLIADHQIVTIPNGIDLTPPAALERNVRAEAGWTDDTMIVVFIGRVFPEKAPADFARAAAIVARRQAAARFLFIGNGPGQAQLDDEVAAANLGGRWRQIPFLPSAARVLPQCDVFVMPSRREGGPYAPLEAMRAGVPVVLTDCVGSRDVLIDGESGSLVPVGDVGAIARAVDDLLADPDRRRRFADAARSRLAERFDVRQQVAATAALYHDTLAEHRSRGAART